MKFMLSLEIDDDRFLGFRGLALELKWWYIMHAVTRQHAQAMNV